MRIGSVILVAVVVGMITSFPASGSAEGRGSLPSQQAVYAAFTVNLTRFVSWPESALGSTETPFVVGTFPRDPINDELDAAVQDENIAGHPLKTIRLRSLNDIRQCQVVYFSRGIADAAAVLARADHRPILTISDTDGFLALGGHVQFVPSPTRTGLQISATNLHASGLEARAQLLRIATTP